MDPKPRRKRIGLIVAGASVVTAVGTEEDGVDGGEPDGADD